MAYTKYMQKITILGSTGSIGTQALEVVRKHADKLSVYGLSVHDNIDLLYTQIAEFSPHAVAITSQSAARAFVAPKNVRLYTGPDALADLAADDGYDTLLPATPGLTCIRATCEGIRRDKRIALANKETLVAAGPIIMRELAASSATLLPVDSEHSALFQCLHGEKKEHVKNLWLTCSGGALRDFSQEELETASLRDALDHKTWDMGDKITIDSATLMNKGFEMIEAAWLYDIAPEKIKVIIHRESIIHSLVEYVDGSFLSQMSAPSMTLPIQYAFSYPERWSAPTGPFDFTTNCTFEKPDLERFPCLSYAYEAFNIGGTMPAAVNAANDYTVEQFLKGNCTYLDIPRTIKHILETYNAVPCEELSDVEQAIADAQHRAMDFLDIKK